MSIIPYNGDMRRFSDNIAFFDLEVNPETSTILDIGAAKPDGAAFHKNSLRGFAGFMRGTRFICGHNILEHDLRFVGNLLQETCPRFEAIDTLPLSALLFPRKPYHHLVKDDILQTDELSNPLNDALKAQDLFFDELNAFLDLPTQLQTILTGLLHATPPFSGFFSYCHLHLDIDPKPLIESFFFERICEHAPLDMLIQHSPIELAYALVLINTDDRHSITPPWVVHHYPEVAETLKLLRGTPCTEGCSYCSTNLGTRQQLERIFGYKAFRTYDGEPLQENAVRAALQGKSLLAIFPTGGGKSLTFQLPALIAGEAVRGLTVVISPLQSLMKDQVDNLEQRNIVDAVTINGMLDPIERKNALDRVEDGTASLLYIAPESLRSKTIEHLLLKRNVIRFVVDEAHCFSAWGQDFRVDYQYIAEFISNYQKTKGLRKAIPVSCFTATAKQKVISDIKAYFESRLGLELELYTTTATRKNLHYAVLFKDTDQDKYAELRDLIEAKSCPTIVYVSRTKHAEQLAEHLRQDGFLASPYHGRMDSTEKTAIQDAFKRNDIKIIVATSAFGMGVDKSDVGLVIHYDIADSLENYVQEAGRAGRDEHLQAECYVLFNDNDLDKHFTLLNQTKLSINEIQQIWRAIKDFSHSRTTFRCSALELARKAGWDETQRDMATRVTNAINALENAGYIKRGQNSPHVYADSILVRTMPEASACIDASNAFTDEQRETAKRIIKYLISRRAIAQAGSDEAESRVDYLADRLGLSQKEVVDVILIMKQIGILANNTDLTACIKKTDSHNKSLQMVKRFLQLESFLTDALPDADFIDYKALNDQAAAQGLATSVRNLKTIVLVWTLNGILAKAFNPDDAHVHLERLISRESQHDQFLHHADLATFTTEYLFSKREKTWAGTDDNVPVLFSVKEVLTAYNNKQESMLDGHAATTNDIQQTLLYLSKIGALDIEGGFLVSYNAMEITRLELNNRIGYKQEDYRSLDEFYKQRMQQIHIVGEYAHLMVKDYDDALMFVSDYFTMDYNAFLLKYFKGNRREEINRNITPRKYQQIFGELSPQQRKIIDDDKDRIIVVAAGPGSGKTKILVHKLASLLMLEDVKHEQLLMLTFSRAAATEFKQRLIDLIGNAAFFIEIKTFHSYAFDLLGRIGNLPDAENVVQHAADMIARGEAEPSRVTKTVLVIDEAQDMDEHEYALVRALLERNEAMRIIAVGDDDQNIYEFRGSTARYMQELQQSPGARTFYLLDNFRSARNIVRLANTVAGTLSKRLKTRPCEAVSPEPGKITITTYQSWNLEEPVLRDIEQRQRQGTCAILTSTNQLALQIAGLLKAHNLPAQLVESAHDAHFDLTDLVEIRYFLNCLSRCAANSHISEDQWKKAEQAMQYTYAASSALPLATTIIDTFAEVNHAKLLSDFRLFLEESDLSDFETTSNESITVSTMYKAKGREFDAVYLLVDRPEQFDLSLDEKKRAVYVAITRAKHELYIHTANPFFSQLPASGITLKTDTITYNKPDLLYIELTHKDVYLNYFKNRRDLILSCRAGDELVVEGNCLNVADGTGRHIVQLSKSCCDRLAVQQQHGYAISKAHIRFIVYWSNKDNPEKTPIILPTIVLKRMW